VILKDQIEDDSDIITFHDALNEGFSIALSDEEDLKDVSFKTVNNEG
jgi:hypothetical protein